MPFKQLRRIRCQQQWLSHTTQSSSAADVVRKLCALQSQEWPSAQLAIAARSNGITIRDVKRSREIDRSFVLTWSLRGTLHLVAAQDIAWQLALVGPSAIRGTNRRYQQLGLGKDIRENALADITDILSKYGALTRAQLAEYLGERGIPVAGQAIHHLLRFAALRGLICLGPEFAGKLTFVLLKEWLPDFHLTELSDEILPILARRYLAAYGPAAPADLCRWSGLSLAKAKTALNSIAKETVVIDIGSGNALMLADQQLPADDQQATIRFLPRYDNYLLAYHSRDFLVDPAHARQIHPGGGLIRSCVIINGQAQATWRLEEKRKTARLNVQPYDTIDHALLPMLQEEAASLGHFLERDIELRIEQK